MPKRGENIYKRRDGRWEGRFIQSRKEDGRAQYSSVYGKTYSDVKAKLAVKRSEPMKRTATCALTVRELLNIWLEAKVRKVKPSTLSRYAALVENHILPRLGELRLKDLTAKKLEEFIDEKEWNGRLDGKGGLSRKTINDMMLVLKSALRLAQKDYAFTGAGVLDVNPPAVKKRKIEIFSEYETKRLTRILMAASDISSVSYLLCLNTGLRLGELCALKWSDIDFQEGVLRVNRTALRITSSCGTRLVVQTPKSDSSERAIPLPDELLVLLGRARGAEATSAFILTGYTDRPMEPRTIQYRFHRFLAAHNFPLRGFHTLRHSFASRCISCGMDAKSLSEILGHSSVKTTLQLYVHPSMEQKRAHIQCASTLRPDGRYCV